MFLQATMNASSTLQLNACIFEPDTAARQEEVCCANLARNNQGVQATVIKS